MNMFTEREGERERQRDVGEDLHLWGCCNDGVSRPRIHLYITLHCRFRLVSQIPHTLLWPPQLAPGEAAQGRRQTVCICVFKHPVYNIVLFVGVPPVGLQHTLLTAHATSSAPLADPQSIAWGVLAQTETQKPKTPSLLCLAVLTIVAGLSFGVYAVKHLSTLLWSCTCPWTIEASNWTLRSNKLVH